MGACSCSLNSVNQAELLKQYQQSLKHHQIYIDFHVFQQNFDTNHDCDTNNDNSHHTCIALLRLMKALEYYSMIDIANNSKHQDLFLDFMQKIYHQFVNDYIHLINDHSQQIETIYQSLQDKQQICDITKCEYTSRHHQNSVTKLSDETLNFYKTIYDTLHFYLYHLFDVGLRVFKGEEEKGEDGDIKYNELKNTQYFDKEFARIHHAINQRKHLQLSFNRFNNSHKFSIDSNTHHNNTGMTPKFSAFAMCFDSGMY